MSSTVTSSLQRLIETPASVEARHRRGYFVMFFGNAVGLINHAAFLLIFALNEVWSLALFNVFSVLLFAFNLVIQRRYGRTLTAMSLAALEVITHQIVAVSILGWGYGFQYYLIVVPAFIYMGHFEGRRAPTAIATLSVVSLLWLWLQGATLFTPHAVMPDAVRELLYGLNLGSTAILVSLFSLIYNQTARRNEEALMAAEADALRASRVKSEFLANMSHELRTPLNAIIGYSEMLEEDADRAEDAEDLQRITAAGRHLLALVNDILDISRIEAERFELLEAPFDPVALLEGVHQLFALGAQERGLTLSVELDPDLPSRLIGDELRLKQVVTNLLSNAVKFTREGEVEMWARAKDGGEEMLLEIGVRDTGIGITPEQLERIFDPFTQADQSIQREFGGTGLGLSISKRLVELMGGRFEAESAPGEGSTFTLCVPFASPAP